MEAATYRFIHFANFKDIPNWSVQYADEVDLGFTQKYPMARIRSFLMKSNDIIEVQDGVEYKQVTLKINNGGVVPRNDGNTVKGIKIGTKRQHVIHAGQFIMSKIDARNGAYGIVPEELDGAIVTNDFPVFDVDTKIIIPQFLVLVSTTDNFIEFARKCSSGTTNRKRIDIDAFLQQQIPLPSIEEQKAILDGYNQQVNYAKDASEIIKKLKENKNEYLRKELNFKYNKRIHKDLLQFISFTSTNRWDVQYYSSEHEISSQYDTVTMESALEFFMQEQKFSLRIETNKYPKEKFHYIGMENVVKDDGCLLDMPIIRGSDIKSQTIRIPEGFIIFGKLRPYLNKYWMNNTGYSDIVCSSEFFCFKPKESFNADFFKYVLSSFIIQEQIADSMSGARMPRIDEKIFMNIAIPFPPMDVQDRIANYLNSIDGQIHELKEKVNQLKEDALNTFNDSLFKR